MPTPPTVSRVSTNGIELQVTEAGNGPLVILLHGWPECSYSWRHQVPALAAAGYRVVAPDLRGFGASDAPTGVEQYEVHVILADILGLMDALGEDQAVVVGHDWGAILAWQFALLAPERFRAVVGMSVPYWGRGPASIVESLKRAFRDNFNYILYFQEPGIADAEFNANPRGILAPMYAGPGRGAAGEQPRVTDPAMSAGGMIDRLVQPQSLPAWLSPADLDTYVEAFTRSGFTGGLNYYRNFHRNWETTPELAGRRITQPALFIAGVQDPVLSFGPGSVEEQMGPSMEDLREILLIPETGHWVQQERPAEVNAALLSFLADIDAGIDPSSTTPS
jgi:pimeloyl-ACP methyl ester carboxylesterase